jgi:glucose uptake protein GlcU
MKVFMGLCLLLFGAGMFAGVVLSETANELVKGLVIGIFAVAMLIVGVYLALAKQSKQKAY